MGRPVGGRAVVGKVHLGCTFARPSLHGPWMAVQAVQSHIQIFDVQGVPLDKLASRLHLLSHEDAE